MKDAAPVSGRGRLHRWFWLLAVAWTLAAGAALWWNLYQHEQHTISELAGRAETLFKQDLVYRRWNAGHGGVYVPVTKQTPPSPYLAHIPERDISTPSGKRLTLMNPAYMTRQVHELMQQEKGGVRGHITSLKPIRPENAADAWEASALRRFEKGVSEVSSLETMADGREYVRFMRPMRVEEPCLKCHATQGYKLGDIRGGISVSIPLERGPALMDKDVQSLIFGYGSMWLLGLGAILFVARRQGASEAALIHSEARVKQLLESAVEAIYGLDNDGRCTFANPACLRLLGYDSPDELLGRNMHALIHHTRPDGTPYPEEACHIYQVFRKGEGAHVDEDLLWRRDGTSFAAEYWSSPVYHDGVTSGAVVTFVDVSERKRAREALDKRLDELERFQKATIEREFRIKELRDELSRLRGATKAEGGGDEAD